MRFVGYGRAAKGITRPHVFKESFTYCHQSKAYPYTDDVSLAARAEGQHSG